MPQKTIAPWFQDSTEWDADSPYAGQGISVTDSVTPTVSCSRTITRTRLGLSAAAPAS